MKKHTGFLLMTVLASILLFSCRNTENAETESEYIALYSTSVPVKSPVIIRLGDPYSLKEDLDEETAAKNIKIRPAVPFTVEITNNNTLKIIPSEPLKNAETYTVTIRPGKLVPDCPEKKFSFQFSTPQPVFTDNAELIADAGTDNLFAISGMISTSDYVDANFIEKNFTVQPGRYTVSWEHSPDGKEHRYAVGNIPAGKKEETITLATDYTPLCIAGKTSHGFTIPAENTFLVMQATAGNDPQHIGIFFSSVLDKNQNIKDFITINGKTDYKYTTDRNKVILYPSGTLAGSYEIQIHKEIKNQKGLPMESDFLQKILLGEQVPSISFLNKGNILPPENNNTLLFQSVNYAKARIRVKQIYKNNILQFLQENDLDDYYNLYSVSKVIADTILVLGDKKTERLKTVHNFGLDLKEILNIQSGAIYRVEVRGLEPLAEEAESYDSDYYFGDWETYRERSKNIIASDLALIVKHGNHTGQYIVYAINITSGQPENNVKIKAYDPVNQELSSAVTDHSGKAEFTTPEAVNSIFATKGTDRIFIKISENNALQISNFDVGGVQSSNPAVKAFIFGERGVWRPGDTIHICVIPLFEGKDLPARYPVTAELYNPKGQLVQSKVENNSTGMFHYSFATSQNDLTGRWEVKIKIGNEVFSKPVKIETIKPNRLKLALDFKDEILDPDHLNGNLKVEWLFGAPGSLLKCVVKADVSKGHTAFANYKNYVFEDITSDFDHDEYEVARGTTDANGRYRLPEKLDIHFKRAPGFVNTLFTVEGYEPSGDFSSSSFRKTISPFPAYVGLYIPEIQGSWGDSYIDMDQKSTIQVAAVTASGTPARVSSVNVEIYKVSYRWWWNSSDNAGLASYAQDSETKLIDRFSIPLTNGTGLASYSWKDNGYGCYLVKISDPVGGHSSSKLYTVSNSYYGDPTATGENGSVKLSTVLDKESYTVGETARLSIPSSAGSKALVSLEKGNKVLKSFWVDCSNNKTLIEIPVEKEMLPNVYAFVTLIQPHSQTANDAPARMYGIQRINVTDAGSILHPVISAPESVQPQSHAQITISEKTGTPMSYVLMVVDEGLLGLTNFKTPDPWNYLYAREALGVRTWDVYDKIMGAYGGKIEQLFAIGGDNELSKTLAPNEGAMRFKAVAKVLGPFVLPAKKSQTHNVDIPQYIGSLRVMVVATDGRAQGSAQKDIIVKKPLMVQATLPRVVATSEEIALPVTVFALEENLGKITVTLQANDLFTIAGNNSAVIQAGHTGEQIVHFVLKAGVKTGIGKIAVTAKSQGQTATDNIEIDVVNPNPVITVSQAVVLKAGESKNIHFCLAGEQGTNRASVSFSSAPPLNLNDRLKYLLDYPYGCIEQITSSAFAQLGVYTLLDNNSPYKKTAEQNISSVLKRLPSYATGDGSMAYWQGGNHSSLWGTVYAAHFVVCAGQNGYFIPGGLKESLMRYLKNTTGKRDPAYEPVLPYALYVLALNGDPQRSIMNRLKENLSTLPEESQWLLAAAYVLDQKGSVARSIIANITPKEKYNPFSNYFESRERTQALALNTYNLLTSSNFSTSETDNTEAFKLAGILSGYLNNPKQYLSTQSTAWCLISLGEFIRQQGRSDIHVWMNAGGEKYDFTGQKPVLSSEINLKQAKTGQNGNTLCLPVTLENKGSGNVFCNLTSSGIPAKGEETAYASGLKMNVTYYNTNHTPVSPENIAQGTDFYAAVTITNTSPVQDYTNLALNQRMASGWEIENKRVNGSGSYPAGIDYQDIRDDRVCSFFNLGSGKSITVITPLKATYKGKFYLPAVSCEAMYDGSVSASSQGMWVTVK